MGGLLTKPTNEKLVIEALTKLRAHNPFGAQGAPWIYVVRPSDWDRGRNGHVPGVIVEPLIGTLISSPGAPLEIAPDWSGVAYAERPGPDWGTYAIVGAGLGGATRGGFAVGRDGALKFTNRAAQRPQHPSGCCA